MRSFHPRPYQRRGWSCRLSPGAVSLSGCSRPWFSAPGTAPHCWWTHPGLCRIYGMQLEKRDEREKGTISSTCAHCFCRLHMYTQKGDFPRPLSARATWKMVWFTCGFITTARMTVVYILTSQLLLLLTLHTELWNSLNKLCTGKKIWMWGHSSESEMVTVWRTLEVDLSVSVSIENVNHSPYQRVLLQFWYTEEFVYRQRTIFVEI